MLSGLFKDLPKAKDEVHDDGNDAHRTNKGGGGNVDDGACGEETKGGAPKKLKKGWVGTGLYAPPIARPSLSTAVKAGHKRGIGKFSSVHEQKQSNLSVENAGKANELEAGKSMDEGKVTIESALPSWFGQKIEDEYDPASPNDYESVRKQREIQRLQAEAEAERQEKMRELKKLEELEEKRDAEEKEAQRKAMLAMSGEEAWKRRAGLSQGSSEIQNLESIEERPVEKKGMDLAQKMLEKMGWKSGEGLGKRRQGISAPLAVEKTSAKAGRIIAQQQTSSQFVENENTASERPEEFGEPSRVILLLNVVPAGGVDESLDEEIGMECSKYGTVLSVLIFEVIEPGYPSDEAVRIFVQFEEQSASLHAIQQLHGRIFDGRVVHAKYFNENRFEAGDLAPEARKE